MIKTKLKDYSYSMCGEFIRDDGEMLEFEEATFFLKEDIDRIRDKIISENSSGVRDYNKLLEIIKKAFDTGDEKNE